jgi:hypothetical protein
MIVSPYCSQFKCRERPIPLSRFQDQKGHTDGHDRRKHSGPEQRLTRVELGFSIEETHQRKWKKGNECRDAERHETDQSSQ